MKKKGAWEAVLAGEAVWRASSGAWLSNHALWPSLLLTGCELETYFGHWYANELTKCPNSLSASIIHIGEHWELRKNFRGTYICKDLYTCVCLPTHMRNEGAFEKWDPAEQTPVSPRGSSPTHLWVSSFCFSNSRLFRSCSFCLSRSASMDFCFCSCCLLCISLSSWVESGHIMKTWAEAHACWPAGNASQWQSPRHWQVTFQGWQTFT